MFRDKRYMPIKVAIEGGVITEFQQIFEFIPPTVIGQDIQANYDRVKKLRTNPEMLTYEEAFLLSDYIQIAYEKVGELVYNQVKKSKGKG